MLIEEICALLNSLKVLYALEDTFIFIEIIVLIVFCYIKNICISLYTTYIVSIWIIKELLNYLYIKIIIRLPDARKYISLILGP